MYVASKWAINEEYSRREEVVGVQCSEWHIITFTHFAWPNIL